MAQLLCRIKGHWNTPPILRKSSCGVSHAQHFFGYESYYCSLQLISTQHYTLSGGNMAVDNIQSPQIRSKVSSETIKDRSKTQYASWYSAGDYRDGPLPCSSCVELHNGTRHPPGPLLYYLDQTPTEHVKIRGSNSGSGGAVPPRPAVCQPQLPDRCSDDISRPSVSW